MKRIAIISLALVFLTTNLSYASSFPIERLYQAMEKAQMQELTQEEVNELYIEVIGSINPEYLEALDEIGINPTQYCPELLRQALILLLTVPVFGLAYLLVYYIYCM